MFIIIQNLKVRSSQINNLQSNHHYTYKNLFIGILSTQYLNSFHCEFFDSICVYLAIYDNCNYDKLVTNFWCFRNASDSIGQFYKFWRIERISYSINFNIRMEAMCLHRYLNSINNHFYNT